MSAVTNAGEEIFDIGTLVSGHGEVDLKDTEIWTGYTEQAGAKTGGVDAPLISPQAIGA